MARKDAIQNMKDVLIKRRDALRKALAGDLSMLKELREQTGETNLCLTGGVALNSLANGRIMREGTPGAIADDPTVREIYLGKDFRL